MGRSKAPNLPIKVLSFCRPTELRGKGGGASHQRGISLARRAVVKVFYKRAPSINIEAPSATLSGIAAVKLKNPRGDSPVSRVDGIRLLCPPLTEPYVRFSRIRLLE